MMRIAAAITMRRVLLTAAFVFICLLQVVATMYLLDFRAHLIDARAVRLVQAGQDIVFAYNIVLDHTTSNQTDEMKAFPIRPEMEMDELLLMRPLKLAELQSILYNRPNAIRAHVKVFASDGKMVLDSFAVASHLDQPEVFFPHRLKRETDPLKVAMASAVDWLYRDSATQVASDMVGHRSSLEAALTGRLRATLERMQDGGLVMSVAVPITRQRTDLGALLLTSDCTDVDELLWRHVLLLLASTLVFSIFSSLLCFRFAGGLRTGLARASSANF
ncbi:hypothetical protein [Bradyrhizobium sp. 21]|uniref:hypothetical protein n=1 Tax=Bradyrhizobium sp. 21 TaxID=2782666 RepID=UPI001FFB51A6|nr:hypothetical protein [Bradyrhizobium sp. 21]MCK1389017.1 hypothetical protein [Bradyrhizobium sp. 21]